MIHSSNSELLAAARAMAWREGVSVDAMESIVAKVAAIADRQRIAAFVRDADNDDGGTG
jgi:hypothetical protein